jgi:RNA polymerase sigma-70 factor (ECF subfamily)
MFANGGGRGRPVRRDRLRSLPVGSRADDDRVTWLALKAGRGDSSALEQFIKATERDVWRLVAYLADPASADDLTQETFLRALGSLPRFTGRSSARTWLLSIARRVVVDQIRRNQSRPRSSHPVDLDRVLDNHRSARRFEEFVEIRMLVDGLDADRRDALMLTQVLGLSYAEAAEVCRCPVGTIRSRVARARDDLLAAVDREGRTG